MPPPRRIPDNSYPTKLIPSAQRHPITKLFIFVFLFVVLIQPAQPKTHPATELLTFEELVELYERDEPSEQLQVKLQKLLTTPFVNNESTANGALPLKPNSNALGRSLRIAQWNIERGLEYEALETVFTDPSKFVSLLDQAKYPQGSPRRAIVLEQVALLTQADLIVLNEVDWGMKRSRYRNVIAYI